MESLDRGEVLPQSAHRAGDMELIASGHHPLEAFHDQELARQHRAAALAHPDSRWRPPDGQASEQDTTESVMKGIN